MVNLGKGLLERMTALETYHPNNINNNNEEYKHAANFLAKKGDSYSRKSCGTLSKSQWEASCK